MTGTAKGTVLRLLELVGIACAQYQDETLVDLPCRLIQADEIWSFCYAKQKNVSPANQREFGYGDVRTWTAIDAETKLVPSWLVGLRDAGYAYEFMTDLADRLRYRVQLTTDGHRAYLTAVEDAFGADIDYAMLVKLYGPDPMEERHYSPPVVIAANPAVIQGNPDPAHVSTSYVERQKPYDAHEHAPLCKAHQRVLQEGRESGTRRGAPLHVLQLRPTSQVARQHDHSSDGCQSQRPCVESPRNRGACPKLTHYPCSDRIAKIRTT